MSVQAFDSINPHNVMCMQVVDPNALQKLLHDMQVAADRQRLVALLSVMHMAAVLAKSLLP